MNVKRSKIILKPDSLKVILKPFEPYDKTRILKIIDRILKLSEEEVLQEYNVFTELYSSRHKKIEPIFIKRFAEVTASYPNIKSLSSKRMLLIGSYFTNEYSLEHAALFNPSMVLHPDQSELSEGNKRFIISLRATGEGHISSIEFRSGIIDIDNNIQLDGINRFVVMPEISNLTDKTYEVHFDAEIILSERVLFPQLLIESRGIEDARFVRFEDENNNAVYYATYCAYDGYNITMRLLQTEDFRTFISHQLEGTEVQNKGMALFPRKINGQYAMLSRQDNENNYIMFSDNLLRWDSKQLLMEPKFPWEFFQIGNCGSPIETDKGWLCLSHGVGAARRYSIGAFLLDKDNPNKLIGRLKTPLLEPDQNERDGYVPNVVYTCGGIINGKDLVFPYAMSDYANSFASVDLNELLAELING